MKLEISGVKKSYGRKVILKDVNISASEGSCVALLGFNGSGKSTLLNIIAGISSCRQGEFMYDGKDMFRCNKKDRCVIGYVPQNPPLIDELTALDNLKLWYSKKMINRLLDDGVLKDLGIGEFLKVPVCKMSGGMKKRLSIACAVSNNPEILIMDEPTAALDMLCKKTVSDYVNTFKKNGGIVLFSTHDSSELSYSDKVYILKDGKTIEYHYDGDDDKLIGCMKNEII